MELMNNCSDMPVCKEHSALIEFYCERCSPIQRVLNNLLDRIVKLESKQEPLFTSEMHKDVTQLLNRVHRLEELMKFSDHDERIHALESKFEVTHDKKPHKCPLCNGEGKIETHSNIVEAFETRIIDNLGRHFKKCNSCEGKGIIWG